MTKLEIYDYLLHYDIRPLADRLEKLLSEDRITTGACYYVYNPYEFYSLKQVTELFSKACESKNYSLAGAFSAGALFMYLLIHLV